MLEKDHCLLNLNPFFKNKMFGKISLSPLEKYELSISLSLLKIGEQHLKFLFLFSKMEKLLPLLFLDALASLDFTPVSESVGQS